MLYAAKIPILCLILCINLSFMPYIYTTYIWLGYGWDYNICLIIGDYIKFGDNTYTWVGGTQLWEDKAIQDEAEATPGEPRGPSASDRAERGREAQGGDGEGEGIDIINN